MDQESTDSLNQMNAFDALFKDNNEIGGAVLFNAAFAAEKLLEDADLVLAKECAVIANGTSDGITTDKDGAKQIAADAFDETCGFAHSYFVKKKMTAKATEYQKYTSSHLFHLKDTDFVSKTASISLDLATYTSDVVSEPFFDDPLLAADMLLQGTFSEWMGKYAVNENKINAAKKLFKTKWIPAMEVHYDIMEGLLGKLSGYSSFVESYITILDMVHTGHRDMGVQITATSSVDGSFIKQLEAHFDDYPIANKMGKTNNMGASDKIRLITGQWNIVFIHPLFHSKSMKVIVKRKLGMIHINVVLIPL